MKKKSALWVLTLTAVLFLLNGMGVINWSWYLLGSPIWIYLGVLSGRIHQKIHMSNVDEHQKTNNDLLRRP